MGISKHLSAMLACSASCAGTAALAGTHTGTLRTVVLGPVDMVNTAPLDFGSLAAGAGGTATIDAQTGLRSTSGVVAMGGPVSNARFVATGTPNRIVSLSLSPNPIVISSGAASMTVNQLRVSVNGGGSQPLGPNHNLGPLGVINFAIGGRLNVATGQAEGSYAGIFTLTMDYQ